VYKTINIKADESASFLLDVTLR